MVDVERFLQYKNVVNVTGCRNVRHSPQLQPGETLRKRGRLIPSLGLVVAGDAVYNGIHPYMAETSEHSRLNWIAVLERIEALKPSAVVAGHKNPENSDSPQHIAATQHYIRDFNRLNHETTTTRELYNKMLSLYPDRVNPGSLWGSAKAAKAE